MHRKTVLALLVLALGGICTYAISPIEALLKLKLPEENARRMADFVSFVDKFSKKLPAESLVERFTIFKRRLQWLDSQPKNTVQLMEFDDLTDEEFRTQYLGTIPSGNVTALPTHPLSRVQLNAWTDASWDWRDHGAVTPVKNQGGCGSCFAFGAVQQFEGAHALAGNPLWQFSPQQALDCSSGTCANGGQPYEVLRNFASGGACHTEYYDGGDYSATKGSCVSCGISAKNKNIWVTNPQSENGDLKWAVGEHPVVATIVVSDTWSHWAAGAGVFTDTACSSSNSWHAVLLVGWGTDNGVDYWIVKNSWGTGYADGGYMRMKRGSNICRIADYGGIHSYGLADSFKSVTVADGQTVRLLVKKTGRAWHANDLGDMKISTRWTLNDDYGRFTLVASSVAGYFRIKTKASGRWLRNDAAPGQDYLMSTRYQSSANDDYALFAFELQSDGTYRIRCKADSRYVHAHELGDRLVHTRWYPNDDYCRFFVLEI